MARDRINNAHPWVKWESTTLDVCPYGTKLWNGRRTRPAAGLEVEHRKDGPSFIGGTLGWYVYGRSR